MDILEEIVAHKRQEVEEFKHFLPMKNLVAMVEPDLDEKLPSMRGALMASSTGIIAEMKRKSPSRGWIHRDASAEVIPLDYQKHGATALSILTDNKYFGGYDEFIMMARASGVTLPILYKNFVVDEYQLLQARHTGASAVLLIAAVLTKEECGRLLRLTHELGMEALLEMHSVEDLEYAELGPDLYGINNRNLGTFITDVENSFRLAEQLPQGECLVSESGIGDAATIRQLRHAGYRGFLMGEHFMKEENPGEALEQLIEELKSSYWGR